MNRLFAFILGMSVSVSGLAIVGLVMAATWWRRPDRRRARLWLSFVFAVLVVASVPVVPLAVFDAYARYHPFVASDLPGAHVIVLLGAGTVSVSGTEGSLSVLSSEGASRVLEAVRVRRLLSDPWIISSGGKRPSTPGRPSSVVMQQSLVQEGVRSERILLESKSLTTRDEAILIAPLLRDLQAERFVLVTSRKHMPRAEGAFRALGLMPVPAGAPNSPLPLRDRWIPSAEGLRLTRELIHELLGLAYYRIRGWVRHSDIRTDLSSSDNPVDRTSTFVV